MSRTRPHASGRGGGGRGAAAARALRRIESFLYRRSTPLTFQKSLYTLMSAGQRQGQPYTRYWSLNFTHGQLYPARTRHATKRVTLRPRSSPQPPAPTRRALARESRGVGEDRAQDGCLAPRRSRERSCGVEKSVVIRVPADGRAEARQSGQRGRDGSAGGARAVPHLWTSLWPLGSSAVCLLRRGKPAERAQKGRSTMRGGEKRAASARGGQYRCQKGVESRLRSPLCGDSATCGYRARTTVMVWQGGREGFQPGVTTAGGLHLVPLERKIRSLFRSQLSWLAGEVSGRRIRFAGRSRSQPRHRRICRRPKWPPPEDLTRCKNFGRTRASDVSDGMGSGSIRGRRRFF